MAQIDEIIAEADEYTDYCRLISYQTAKAVEYVEKAAQQALSTAGLLTAAFPIVGATIIASKAAITQALIAASEPIEATATALATAAKLAELGLPTDGCPDTIPPIPPIT